MYVSQVLTEIAEQNCLDLGENNKVRCAVEECKKLFKGKEFLKKHVQNKHPELVLERLVRIAERHMLTRFESEVLTSRMLPPVEMEGGGGKIEERFVRDIRENALNKTQAPLASNTSNHSNTRRGEKRRFSNDFSDHRGGGGGGWEGDFRHPMGGGGHRDRRDSRDNGGFSRPPPPPFSAPPPPIPQDDPNARTLNAYRDVDAPIAVSCVDSDFGVSLPPPKKRKLIIKKK